jgi:coproporphyrinogen III oxidase-like Fe-S oxidoreductase
VPAAELPFEFMLNALRLTEGFRLEEFERSTGLPGAAVVPKLGELEGRGLVCRHEDRYRASALGFRFLNDVLAAFLPDENSRRTPGELYTAPARFVSDRDFHDFVSEVR